MRKWQINADFDDWFYSHPESERIAFEREEGICWAQCSPEMKVGVVKAWAQRMDRDHEELVVKAARDEDYGRALDLQRRSQEFVQQSQGIKSLLNLNIDEANPPLMTYGLTEKK